MQQPQEKGARLRRYIELAERLVYYGAAAFLLGTIGLLFFSTASIVVEIGEVGALDTSLEILDRVLLIFIFTELLSTIGTIVREEDIVAEPFLLIGLIAVVRRVLAVTADIEQSLGTPEFDSLIIELGVLTVLILALAAAIYFTRKARQAGRSEGPQ